VSAIDKTDTRPSWANVGSCVDLFAPGVGITSDFLTSDTAAATMSGTSMATPHVAGVAALYLSANPTATPSDVTSALESAATTGVVNGAGSGTPNLLLFEIQRGGVVTVTTTNDGAMRDKVGRMKARLVYRVCQAGTQGLLEPASASGSNDAAQPQPHAPPQAQPPCDGAAPLEPDGAMNEKRRRTRSLPHEGHARATSTLVVIERRSSNARSQPRHTYS
jgi:hypothetical protein